MTKKRPDSEAANVADHGAVLRAKLAERRSQHDAAIADATAKFDAYGLAAALATVGRGSQGDADRASDELDAANMRVAKLAAEIAGLDRLLVEHEAAVEAQRRRDVHAQCTALAARVEKSFGAAEAQMRSAMREWCAGQAGMAELMRLLESLGGIVNVSAYLAPVQAVGGPPNERQLEWVRALQYLVADESAGRLPPPNPMRPPEWAIPPAFAERVTSFLAAALVATDPTVSTPDPVEREAA